MIRTLYHSTRSICWPESAKEGFPGAISILLIILLLSLGCQPAEQPPIQADIPNSLLKVPTRVLTQDPKHHWFGYYDKLEFDPTGRYVLTAQVDFEGRSPRPDDTIRVGMIDLHNKDQWTELGTSVAWGWQQGCMLQFIPGSASKVIWNDRQGDQFVILPKSSYFPPNFGKTERNV